MTNDASPGNVMPRRMTNYRVVSYREVPALGRSIKVKIELDIACPMDAVLETNLVGCRLSSVEGRPHTEVVATHRGRDHLTVEESP